MTEAGVTLAEVSAYLQVAEETIHRWIPSKPVLALPLSSPVTPAAAAVPIAQPAATIAKPPASSGYIEDPVKASVALLNLKIRCNGSNIRKAHARGWHRGGQGHATSAGGGHATRCPVPPSGCR